MASQAKKPLEVFEWALALKDNLPHDAPSRQTDKAVIRFQTEAEALGAEGKVYTSPKKSEPDGVYKSVAQFQQAVKFETTKNEQMLKDIMKRIWGEDFPETFLTEVLAPVPRSPMSAGSTRRARSPAPRPICVVEKQAVPPELASHTCPLPPQCRLDEITSKVVLQDNAAADLLAKKPTHNIIQDGFWWIFVQEFCSRKDRSVQSPIFDRMCEEFVKISLSLLYLNETESLQNYHDSLSQCIYYSFRAQYTESTEHFNNNFKNRILLITAEWTLGFAPRNLTFNHWTPDPVVQVDERRRQLRKYLDEEVEVSYSISSVPIIPIRIKKETIRIQNSGFLTRFLEIRQVSSSCQKYYFKASFTQADRTTVEDINIKQQERLREVNQMTKASKSLKTEVDQLREGFAAFTVDDHAHRKDVLKELELELLESKHSANRSVKQILEDLGLKPNQKSEQ